MIFEKKKKDIIIVEFLQSKTAKYIWKGRARW